MKTENKLSPDDQAKVDGFINSGYNDIERRPFRPIRLALILWGIVAMLGLIAWLYAKKLGFA